MAEAKAALRRSDREFADTLQAAQTAAMVTAGQTWVYQMLNIDPSKVVPVPPDRFMVFNWKPAEQQQDDEEITDEMIAEFDRRMDSWELKSREMMKK